ncbi:MAG: acyl-CoA dehydrogenase [Nocardiaceae bacterium]|nr:acyl-CoA dehydrogenase [Nocardiaceae bacterium]
MDFSFTNEQLMLRDTVAKFLSARYDLEKSRAAAKSGAGWQPEIWRGFADELGILGATFPESVGGLDGGPTELMIILEALGNALVIEPFVETVVLAGGLLKRAGAEDLLGQIAAGDAVVAVAATEWDAVMTTARRDGDEWVLDGEKIAVIAAPIATHLLVSARTDADRIALFVVPAKSQPGLTSKPMRTIDDRTAADLTFDGLRLPAESLLVEDAWASLDQARDEATAAIVSEAVGLMRKVLADTVEYTKQRSQFGVPISSFQALQHRMVDMYMEVEQAAAAQYLAALKLDAEPAVRARAVSAAKATVCRAARFVGQNAVQLHGAMGMTEELAIGHYFKRLTAIEYEFGSRDWHLDRYAALT